ncbi:conserved exported protein of unknown function [Pseudodesulfovibrio profundus]|uniref:Thioredoxin-like fold domain-containing protein n=1 Tax=Pseudodesulfovibrio profundus TaxID=57320 RepID=A0A2C8FBP7_9BACT|nr:hypothetical protein [Pseudodesulfovibrio profundus]SOB59865.1 conserved exported protein of unknown function [Pseudodesulfovibrio profundus]
MRKYFFLTSLALALIIPSFALAADKPVTGCSPQYAAITDSAKVIFEGTGDLDITVITDPLCWHCRLGHKLLNEYPKLYGKVRMVFFPRTQFIGSDMAAWILEDAAGTDSLKDKVDFAYKHLRQPTTEDITEARMVVLSQFLVFFPEMLEGTSMEELYLRLQNDHEAHVLETARLCEEAGLAGTPVLFAGKVVLVGYGAGPWIKALEEKQACD